MLDFTTCQAKFLDNATNLQLYSYTGPVFDVPGTDRQFITTEGCLTLCGSGADFYAWSISSQALLTWVVPMLVMFLLAPFEPNQTGNTILASLRWLGSPFVSMAYVYRNIRATSRCAEMVDMAVGYRSYPAEDSDFGEFRDSMTILACMNQYLLNEAFTRGEDSRLAEQLLRVSLFSRVPLPNGERTLLQRRQKLAASIRAKRRRGVVPIFFGLLWFLFVFAISVEFTFEDMGENTAAHNLAMGFSLCWLVPLVIGAVVDSNLTAHQNLREKFNKLITDVHTALQTKEGWDALLHELDSPQAQQALVKPASANEQCIAFFVDFAGQGRVGWHRSLTHPILAGIDSHFAAMHGRGWLDQQSEAKKALLIPGYRNFGVFEPEMIWHTFSAFKSVYGSLAAAFLISFFTPPVGIGCRAGGFMMYAILTFTAALAEVLVEVVEKHRSHRWTTGRWCLIGLEIASVCWLIYITIAQTFGIYNTCKCLGQPWAAHAGYIPFDGRYETSDLTFVVWSIATGVAGSIVLGNIVFFVVQWCQQSHIQTSSYADAMHGLRWTRRCRRVVGWVNTPARVVQDCVEAVALKLWSYIGTGRQAPAQMRWSVRFGAKLWTPSEEPEKTPRVSVRDLHSSG